MGFKLQAQAQKETIKSAKAAIMSRNMSHNIGSHVMSYLKQKLGSITAIMSDENKVLYNLTDDEYLKSLMSRRELGNPEMLQTAIQNVRNAENAEKDKPTSKKIQFPFLVGTGRFIGYLQERQDYIATIATDYIPYGAPVNLKDAIYDELNPDLRHMRHNESSQDDDGNRPMNVLLSFIAKSEGLSRENMEMVGQSFKTHNDILFGFPKYENEGTAPHVFGIESENSKTGDVALTEMRKVNFSLPGGLVGRQAIFSIVENLIRNAAKHGNPCSTKQDGEGKDVGNLELTFDVIDLASMNSEPCINERIYDSKWRELYKASIDHDQLYLFTITDNIVYKTDSEGRSLAERMRPALIEEYLDDNGNMRPTNKGIKEIRISAAWVRNEVEETRYLRYEDYAAGKPIPQKKAPLVAIEMTKEGHLRYMICLPQDRMAAVITDGMSDDNKRIFKNLSDYSSKDWTLYESIEAAKKDNKISYHYIFVADEEKYNEFRPYTSNRLFVWNPADEQKQEITRLQEETDAEVRYKHVKNAIVRMLHGINDQSEPIYIWDSKTVDSQSEEDKKNRPDKVIVERSDTDADKAKYVYRTHHSTDTQFETYWKKKSLNEAYNNIVRIDAITGDNSSDRIVRREPLNEEWYCSHLRALKKRVAIFDERLFKIVHNVDEEGFVVNNSSIDTNQVCSLITRIERGENRQEINNEIIERKLFGQDTEAKIMFSADYKSKESLLEKLKGKLVSFNPKSEKNHKSIVYYEKGVDVFTIIKERAGAFAIVGYVGNVTDKEGNLQTTQYDKIATITSSKDPFDVKIKFQHPEFAKQYDYISIHQGILDKIYEAFGIKEHGRENDPKKCHVTKRLHEEFIKEGYKPIPTCIKGKDDNDKQDFLPCFIIHSGRAKPTKNDMPQELPFVQYAAIEHAVLDCKYSLVELLDYARYES